MWILLTAVASASLLGSMHCVGMCGPLAIWASGAGDTRRGTTMFWATTLYHGGRLVTYLLVGLLAGFAGGLVDWGGEALGVQLVAAKVVGIAMVAIGLVRLWQLAASSLARRAPAAQALAPSAITRVLVSLRPYVFRLPIPARGLVTGLLTALLPCGWLYLFALVAAGTGSAWLGAIVMASFWLGTVPLLVGLVAGSQALAVRFRRLVPAVAAVLLIVGGGYTAAGRGFANLNSLADIRRAAATQPESSGSALDGTPRTAAAVLTAELKDIVETPLPCCEVIELPDLRQGAPDATHVSDIPGDAP